MRVSNCPLLICDQGCRYIVSRSHPCCCYLRCLTGLELGPDGAISDLALFLRSGAGRTIKRDHLACFAPAMLALGAECFTGAFRKSSSEQNRLNSSRGRPYHKMDHLACFAPAMLALGAKYGAVKGAKAEQYMQLAVNLTETCYQMYARQPTGRPRAQ